jgi:flagellar hook assembly protein FlgD
VVPVLALEQNYPNPFNPTTTIRYSLDEQGMMSLDIYNIKGQLVKSLYHGNAEAGSHSVIWNGRDNSGKACASGVYFYKLRTSKTSLVRKMLLMK